MLIIRQAQLDALAKAPRLDFENRLIRHSTGFYPAECAAMGPDRVRELAQRAIEIATDEGFPREREIAYFLSLMFIFGADFHRDPQLPWNFGDLEDTRLSDRVGAMDQFFTGAMTYLDDIAGPDNGYLIRAMLRVRDFDLATAPALGDAFETEACAVFRKFWPEKFDYQGEDATRAVIQAGAAEAADYGIADNQGILAYTGLMFMVGSGMHRDPVYGWSAEVLNDPELGNDATRGRRLFEAAIRHIVESLGAGRAS